MTTCPLLHNVCHRAMIAPVSPLRTRFIQINPSYWTIYCEFEISLQWELSIDWNSNRMFYANHLIKKILESDIIYTLKILFC